jgi:acetyltransferase-like isoleucine patch superfamily enzyme
MFPTVVGSVLRGVVYKNLLGSVGSSCFIERNVRLNVPQKIFLGDRVFIGEGNYLDPGNLEGEIRLGSNAHVSRCVTLRAGTGKIIINGSVNLGSYTLIYGSGDVEIGKNSLLSPGVQLISGNHIFKNPDTPIRFQGAEVGRIEIGEDVWLGSYAVVLAGVTIGKGSVIGAGAVVTKDIPSYSIAAGIPAEVIGKRQ